MCAILFEILDLERSKIAYMILKVSQVTDCGTVASDTFCCLLCFHLVNYADKT